MGSPSLSEPFCSSVLRAGSDSIRRGWPGGVVRVRPSENPADPDHTEPVEKSRAESRHNGLITIIHWPRRSAFSQIARGAAGDSAVARQQARLKSRISPDRGTISWQLGARCLRPLTASHRLAAGIVGRIGPRDCRPSRAAAAPRRSAGGRHGVDGEPVSSAAATRRTALLPGLAQFRDYQRGWLRGDLLAGITVAAYLVPQVMAYAEVAGLPPVTGLWAMHRATGRLRPARLVPSAVDRPGIHHRADDRGGADADGRGRPGAVRAAGGHPGPDGRRGSVCSAGWPGWASWPTCCPSRCWSATWPASRSS